jgi:hypothetical protein
MTFAILTCILTDHHYHWRQSNHCLHCHCLHCHCHCQVDEKSFGMIARMTSMRMIARMTSLRMIARMTSLRMIARMTSLRMIARMTSLRMISLSVVHMDINIDIDTY